MELIEGVALSELCDYSFGDQSGQWGNIYTSFMKDANLLNTEFASKVFDSFPEKINSKMTEREITAIFKRELINEGADYILYMACASGQGGYDQIINNPTFF